MSDLESEPQPHDVGKRGGRATTVVAVAALVVAVLGGAVAVLSYVKTNQVEDDLHATQVVLRSVRNDLDDAQTHLQSAEGELNDLVTEVQSVRDDFTTASATVDAMDTFLRTNTFASADDVGNAISDVGSHIDDVVSCLNDNLDLISQGRQLQFC